MAKTKKEHVEGRQPTERQQRIRDLQGLKKHGRSTEESAELAQLHAEERRERWERLHARRVRNARKALRNVIRLGDPKSYQYTADEATALVKVIDSDVAELRRAFTGAPKERGLYDL